MNHPVQLHSANITKMKLPVFVILLYWMFIVLPLPSLAQKDADSLNTSALLRLESYWEAFYTYDFNKPQDLQRQNFLFNHNRHNSVYLNLGVMKLNYESDRIRSNFAVHGGTYVNDNYVAEPGLLKNVHEANVGVALSKHKKTWLDAGVMPSYIGFESAIGYSNWTLTRSLLAENSPYFVTGMKFAFNPNERLAIATLLMNGWQRIQWVMRSSFPAFGTQINFKRTENQIFNWSSFLGKIDLSDSVRLRFFNNFYAQFSPAKKWKFIAGFDFGMQQALENSQRIHTWFSPVLISQFSINTNWKSALRLEYYHDPKLLVVSSPNGQAFRTSGISINVDYSPFPELLWRLEARWLQSAEPIFKAGGNWSKNNVFITTSCSIQLSKILKQWRSTQIGPRGNQ